MNENLNILRIIKQKIPSDCRNVIGFEEIGFTIPRKTNFSGHFRLNAIKTRENLICN